MFGAGTLKSPFCPALVSVFSICICSKQFMRRLLNPCGMNQSYDKNGKTAENLRLWRSSYGMLSTHKYVNKIFCIEEFCFVSTRELNITSGIYVVVVQAKKMTYLSENFKFRRLLLHTRILDATSTSAYRIQKECSFKVPAQLQPIVVIFEATFKSFNVSYC